MTRSHVPMLHKYLKLLSILDKTPVLLRTANLHSVCPQKSDIRSRNLSGWPASKVPCLGLGAPAVLPRNSRGSINYSKKFIWGV